MKRPTAAWQKPSARWKLRFLVAVAFLMLCGAGPCGPISGKEINGKAGIGFPDDWVFTNEFSTIQVETNPAAPYSVTTWVVTDGPNLYVASRRAAAKQWVQNVQVDPDVRIGLKGQIYKMTAERMTDAVVLQDLAARMRAKYLLAKLFMDADPANDPDTWYFRLVPAE